MASRILGMGDVVSLVEKAQEQFSEEQAKKLEDKLKKNQFTIQDFYEQIQTIKKMGSVRDLLGMIPGMDRAMKGVSIDENAFKHVEAIILSMTKEERQRPELIDGGRRRRIALGSGTKVQDVNRLLKQFDQMRRTMKKLTRGNARELMQGMQGMNMPMLPGFGRRK